MLFLELHFITASIHSLVDRVIFFLTFLFDLAQALLHFCLHIYANVLDVLLTALKFFLTFNKIFLVLDFLQLFPAFNFSSLRIKIVFPLLFLELILACNFKHLLSLSLSLPSSLCTFEFSSIFKLLQFLLCFHVFFFEAYSLQLEHFGFFGTSFFNLCFFLESFGLCFLLLELALLFHVSYAFSVTLLHGLTAQVKFVFALRSLTSLLFHHGFVGCSTFLFFSLNLGDAFSFLDCGFLPLLSFFFVGCSSGGSDHCGFTLLNFNSFLLHLRCLDSS